MSRFELRLRCLGMAAYICVLGLASAGHGESDRVSQLIGELKGANADKRIVAASMLGDLRDPRAVDPLIGALKNDPSASVRYTAATALGGIKESRSVEALIGALEDPDAGVRQNAAGALGKLKDARAVVPLIAAMKDVDRFTRNNAVAALAGFQDPRAVEALSDYKKVLQPIAALRDAEPWVRLEAAEALGEAMDSRAIDPLVAALRDPAPGVQRTAASSLAQIGTPAVEALIAALKDKSADVRGLAAVLLGRIKDPRAVEPLIASLKDKDSEVGRIQKDGFSMRLSSGREAGVGDSGVRGRAAESLGAIGDPRAVEPLIVSLKDVNAGVRVHAAIALGQIGDPRGVAPLFAALKDSVTGFSAANGLGKIGSAGIPPLIAALKSRDRNVREDAASTLGESKDPRAVAALLSALKERDVAAIVGAHVFFIGRGEPGSESALIEALEKFGGVGMAETCLNSGNVLLAQAARTWATKRGYEIKTSPGGIGAGWGRAK